MPAYAPSEDADLTGTADEVAGADVTEPSPFPYQKAGPDRDRLVSLDCMSDQQLLGVIIEVVEVEGPVHAHVVAKRLASCRGVRVNRRLQERIVEVSSVVGFGRLDVYDGLFLSLSGRSVSVVRNRKRADEDEKKVAHLPPSEIELAVTQAVQECVGLGLQDCHRAVADAIGVRAHRNGFTDLVDAVVDRLVKSGVLMWDETHLRIPQGVSNPSASRFE